MCALDPPCPCRSDGGGKPVLFACSAVQASRRHLLELSWSGTIPNLNLSCLGRFRGSAELEGAGLHDYLVLDSEPLTPRRNQDWQGALQFAVRLPDPGPGVAQGDLRPGRQKTMLSTCCQLLTPC